MQIRPLYRSFFRFITLTSTLGLLTLLVSSCGARSLSNPVALEPVLATTNSCVAGQVQIMVLDGSLQRLCGCNETAGDVAAAGTELVCTAQKPMTLVFLFVGNQVAHQIQSLSDPGFVSSSYLPPVAASAVRVHALTISTAGTYRFQDAVIPSVTGKIIVTN
jgi:hypothetical protein